MSLLNNNNKNKDKKKGKTVLPGNSSMFISPRAGSGNKAASRNKKLTGGSQRGS